MEKEPSDDSYCTTDEGGNDNQQDEDPLPPPLTEKEGDVVQLKDDNVIKIINKVGIESDKPIETDNVVIRSSCSYVDLDSQNEINIPILCEFKDETEINLSDDRLPRSFALGVKSMRIKEEATVKIKFKYIFKHLLKNKKHFENKDELKFLYDEAFQKRYEKEKMIVKITLINFFIIQNLMDKGEIRKKIIKQSPNRKNIYAKNGDIVTYNLRATYKDKELYNKINITSELDKELDVTMFEIEHRLLENVKVGEVAVILVEPSFMTYKNQKFLDHYKLDNTEPTMFYCEVLDINHLEYVYNIQKDKYSKTKVLHEGFGKDCPDREMSIKMKVQIKVNGVIKFNTFECDDIEKDYIPNQTYTQEVMEWRDNINQELQINNIDDEVDYNKDKIIYERCTFKGLLDVDMKLYTIPNLFRKVLVHMKRNQINYIKTTYLDYFNEGNCELYNIGKFNTFENQPNIEIYIHLYEFLHQPMFSKYSYQDKLNQLQYHKTIADDCFKQGKLFRAMKLYHNLKYRFNEGDVFGHDRVNAEMYLKENDKDTYDKLIQMRIATHNNYALCKLKLGKIFSCYETVKRVLDMYDNKNPKALYLYGKCCISMKEYQRAVDALKDLIEVQPNNKDALDLYKEAQRLNNDDLGKNRNMFKKMFKAAD